MRKLCLPLLAALLLLALLGCSGAKKRTIGSIVVSIYPYELLVKQIVGDSLEVRTLIPPASSPHTYSPKPSAIRALAQADLVISNGYGLETNLQQAFASKGDKHIRIEDLLSSMSSVEPETNPHVWLSPRKLTLITVLLADQLQNRFPALKSTIAKNAAQLISELSALNLRIMQERSTFTKTPVITWHDSFHYFLQDYKIEDLGAVQSSPGKEPTARELSDIGALIKANGIKVLYTEPQMSDKAAKVLANEFDLQLVELDPMGRIFAPSTILDVILNNWEGLKLGW